MVPRDAQQFYPVLIRRLTIGSVTLDHFRPDCESPARSDTFGEGRTIGNCTTSLLYVKHFKRNFFAPFHIPVDAVESKKTSLFDGLRFRDDRDQFFVIPGMVITMKLGCFP